MNFPRFGEPHTRPPDHLGWPRAASATASAKEPGAGHKPLVSVVTPSLDQVTLLEDALASVHHQGYPGIEHVVVDGGSRDGTLEILRATPDVTWVSEPDEGQADALNKGLARARGEILGWLNADDFYEPGAVHAAVSFLVAHPDVDVVYGDCLFLYQQAGGEELRLVRARKFDLDFLLNVGCYIHQPATFFRRSALDVGPLDTRLRYAMDYDLWLRMARAGKRFAYLPVTLATFRISEASKSGASLADFWPEVRGTSRKYGGMFLSPMFLRHLMDRAMGRWPAQYESAKRLYTMLFRRNTPGTG